MNPSDPDPAPENIRLRPSSRAEAPLRAQEPDASPPSPYRIGPPTIIPAHAPDSGPQVHQISPPPPIVIPPSPPPPPPSVVITPSPITAAPKLGQISPDSSLERTLKIFLAVMAVLFMLGAVLFLVVHFSSAAAPSALSASISPPPAPDSPAPAVAAASPIPKSSLPETAPPPPQVKLRPAPAPEVADPSTRNWLEPLTGMMLVPIPAGSCVIGSPIDELGHRPHELRHKVTFEQAFWMGRTEVTQAQWQKLTGESQESLSRRAGAENAIFVGDAAPVHNISWNAAQRFCQALNERSSKLPPGYRYRVPSEAEWEYACRAGRGDKLPPVDTEDWIGPPRFPDRQPLGLDDNDVHLHLVAGKAPNPWGLFDMRGNVAEWCSDFYGPYSSEDAINPRGPSSGQMRILRGGCWFLGPNEARPATRSYSQPSTRSPGLGFRLVLGPE